MSHSSAGDPVDGAGAAGRQRAHRAGAFDVRNFIGMLLGLYGIILVVTALVGSDGRAVNLWAGVGMLVVAACFILWARVRPVVVPDDPESLDAPPAGGH